MPGKTIQKNLRGPFFKFQLRDLKFPNYHTFSLKKIWKMFAVFNNDQIWSAYPPHANKENIKNLRRTFFKFELWDLKSPNYHKFSLKLFFWKCLHLSIKMKFDKHTPYIEQKNIYKNLRRTFFQIWTMGP